MNIMGRIISKLVINCLNSILFLHTDLYNSCWIKSDDGAIAAFIVPIVAIMLVQLTITYNRSLAC